MYFQTAPHDDVIPIAHDAARTRELGEATAWVICAEAGERAREGELQPGDREDYERQIRCALAIDAWLTKTYLGYLDLAILAGQILLIHATRTSEERDASPRCGAASHGAR